MIFNVIFQGGRGHHICQHICAVKAVLRVVIYDFHIFTEIRRFKSLWLSDAIWWHRPGSILVPVMACCLRTPCYHLNQCWLIISKIPWHLHQGIIIMISQDWKLNFQSHIQISPRGKIGLFWLLVKLPLIQSYPGVIATRETTTPGGVKDQEIKWSFNTLLWDSCPHFMQAKHHPDKLYHVSLYVPTTCLDYTI